MTADQMDKLAADLERRSVAIAAAQSLREVQCLTAESLSFLASSLRRIAAGDRKFEKSSAELWELALSMAAASERQRRALKTIKARAKTPVARKPAAKK